MDEDRLTSADDVDDLAEDTTDGRRPINIIHVERFNSEDRQCQRTTVICGTNWDKKHTLLTVLIGCLLVVIIIMADLAIRLSRCTQPQKVVIEQSRTDDSWSLKLHHSHSTTDFISGRLILSHSGNYTLNMTVADHSLVEQMCEEEKPAELSFIIFCNSTVFFNECRNICIGQCNAHRFNVTHETVLNYKVDKNCLADGGSIELREDDEQRNRM